MRAAGTTYQHQPDYAVPPGETLRDTLEELGMTQTELAVRTGLAAQTINRIVRGEQPVTSETASRLELATGVPAGLWNRLEANYKGQLARIAEREALKAKWQWVNQFPIKELIRRELIEATDDKVETLRQVLGFFGVSGVESWAEIWTAPDVKARRSRCFESHPAPTATWLREGEIRARDVRCAPYDAERFRRALSAIRSLTRKPASEFVPQMRDLCAGAGVAFCMIPEYPKAPWSGATRWLSPGKALIMLSLRGKKDDKFWFTFFHEAAHVLHDSKHGVFINNDRADDECEERANRFAANYLVPEKRQADLAGLRSIAEVKALADELGIAPGIVVGQYQYQTGDWKRFNGLKRTFAWKV